ncbi:DUF1266 domain-containing protein [Brachybacterium phenoliresistens]|uniref:DUF1266 domain-containing protein n=1 Tax=Brachybacterium phenoliresistens TaxID=396014 RepID=UPI0031D621DE
MFAAGCLALAVSLYLSALRRPLREQRRYYALRGLEAPDERLRRALRTSAGWSHLKSIWPLTLEVHPSSEGMTPRQARSFRTLPLMSAEENRDGLASDWGILHAQHARATLSEYLNVGVHSHGFAMAIHHGDPDALDSLAALADMPTTRLLEIGSAHEGRPPQLLWGWDLVRTAVIVRQSESAGYLDRETAIDLLEEITDHIVALFPTEQELLENCQLGFALRAGPERRAEVRERKRLDAEYLAGEWPTVLGPWPSPSGRPLPPAMAEGFARDLHPHEDDEDAEGDRRP